MSKENKKPVIGLVPLMDDEKESYWMLPGYMDGIIEAGGIPIMLPLVSDRSIIEQIGEKCDGFLLTGGHDVSPEIYGEKKKEQCGACCKKRDEMERIIIGYALNADKPMLGVCRGIQLLNAVLGGTLYQDIPSEFDTKLIHHQKPPYDVPVHDVLISDNSPLYTLLGKKRLSVNSYHHQAVKDLADGLDVMAKADDGLVEAVYMPSKRFVWGVQWHPEFSYKKEISSRRIFEEFVKASY